MTIRSIKTPITAAVLVLSMTACGFALDFWHFIAGSPAPPPVYNLEINNTSSHSIDLMQMGFSAPGMPQNLAPGEQTVISMPEHDIMMVANQLDSQSMAFPESAQFQCPSGPNLPFLLDYMHSTYDPVDPANIFHLAIHVEFCMKNKCDLSMTPHADTNGFISMVIADMVPPM